MDVLWTYGMIKQIYLLSAQCILLGQVSCKRIAVCGGLSHTDLFSSRGPFPTFVGRVVPRRVAPGS